VLSGVDFKGFTYGDSLWDKGIRRLGGFALLRFALQDVFA
jgi:hypothetical protein